MLNNVLTPYLSTYVYEYVAKCTRTTKIERNPPMLHNVLEHPIKSETLPVRLMAVPPPPKSWQSTHPQKLQRQGTSH